MQLPEGYQLIQVSNEEFAGPFKKHFEFVFRSRIPYFEPNLYLSEAQANCQAQYFEKMGTSSRVNLVLLYKNEWAGWLWGRQDNANNFHLVNGAILPESRQKSLFTALLKEHIKLAKARGITTLTSNHHATNNPVLITMLKAGFVFQGVEVCLKAGTLIRMCYYVNEQSRKVADYRVGYSYLDAELKTLLDYPPEES